MDPSFKKQRKHLLGYKWKMEGKKEKREELFLFLFPLLYNCIKKLKIIKEMQIKTSEPRYRRIIEL